MRKLVTVTLSGFTILVIAVFVFVQSRGTVFVESSPSNVVFELNNNYYYTPFSVTGLQPGEYQLTTHVSGYKDYSERIEVKPFGRITKNIELEKLSKEDAISKDEKKWKEYFESEARKTKAYVLEREAKNPLTKHLPKITDSYWFDYEDKDGIIKYFLKTNNYNQDIKIIRSWIKETEPSSEDINIEKRSY